MSKKKRLVLRLSSLGDVILASSVLEIDQSQIGQSLDWVVAKEWGELLEGHPSINRIWKYRRSSGLLGWYRLCRQLWDEQYSDVIDLHLSLRTRLIRLFFWIWSLQESRKSGRKGPHWKIISKQRAQTLLYLVFKEKTPRSLRPHPWIEEFTLLMGGTGREKPNLRHLIGQQKTSIDRPYLCVMPSSKWNGKKWPVSHYVRVLKGLSELPVILGTSGDRESHELCRSLVEARIEHFNGVGRWSLKETAGVLAYSSGFLGVDTGLAHLAQAVGVPTRIIFGPTSPDLGFGPWGEKSQAIGLDLGCRPCGKAGRFCYRFHSPYECLQNLSPQQVLKTFTSTAEKY